MGIEDTRRAIENLINRRGIKARQIWTVMSGFEPLVPPEVALNNLKQFTNVLRRDLQDEARSLASDVEKILKSPPLP